MRAAVAEWKAEDLETAVVEAGGCAAVMRTREDWLASPGGRGHGGRAAGGRRRPPAGRTARPCPTAAAAAGGPLPYAGVRVLDLTRVIAGPVGTRFLAAYGADVLRIDPPGFAEVPALLPETTAGKRTAALDLTAAADRAAFESLVAAADVLVSGLRADALARLGYDDAALAALNPALIVASLDAYGWDGPWRDRRGFDSLVQMSSGIAAAGAAATGADHPVPLPVQALDHACGYLMAAAVGRALTRRTTESAVSRIRLSLIGTANLLWSLPRPAGQPPMPKPGDFPLTDAHTAWGPARRVPLPGAIAGIDPRWRVEAGPLGRHRPAWAGRAGRLGRLADDLVGDPARDVLRIRGGQGEDDVPEAGLDGRRDRVAGAARIVIGDRLGDGPGDLGRVAADLRAEAVEQRAAGDEAGGVAAGDVPHVGVLGDHAQRGRGAAADHDRRIRALDGLGVAERPGSGGGSCRRSRTARPRSTAAG